MLVLILEKFDRRMKQVLLIAFSIACLMGSEVFAASLDEKAVELLESYCFDCHDTASQKGNLNMEELLKKDSFDGALMFENLLTGKMPPADKDQPQAKEKRELLEWLAGRQGKNVGKSFRRISRNEFVYSLNDLLGTDLDLTGDIPEDRGTNDFDSNRKIQLSREMLESYFSVADKMLDHAFPTEGFRLDVVKCWIFQWL